jgi:predicted ATPase
MQNKFRDGGWWIELAPFTDPALVPQAVGQNLGLHESSDQLLLESLKSFLAQKQLLLILDNCEHLIHACAQLAEQLLSTCDHLRILATSREELGLGNERVWSVPILSLPNPKHESLVESLMQNESIHLFFDRARVANPGFVLSNQNAFSVMQICERLDGMPLAIELAASRIKIMSVN